MIDNETGELLHEESIPLGTFFRAGIVQRQHRHDILGCPDTFRKGMFAQQHYILGRQPMLTGHDGGRKSETEFAHVLTPDFIMKPKIVLPSAN